MKRDLENVSHADLAAEVTSRLTRAGGDWIDAYEAGEALRVDEIAYVLNVSPDTVRRRLAEASDVGEPLGVLIAGSVWLVSLRRVLADTERRRGRHERLAAEDRAQKLLEMRSLPQKLSESLIKRAATTAR